MSQQYQLRVGTELGICRLFLSSDFDLGFCRKILTSDFVVRFLSKAFSDPYRTVRYKFPPTWYFYVGQPL